MPLLKFKDFSSLREPWRDNALDISCLIFYTLCPEMLVIIDAYLILINVTMCPVSKQATFFQH